MARELKTVYIDCSCQYLKLSMQKCFPNDKNIFNQVALVSLRCNGQAMGIYETHALSAKQGSQATQVLSDDPLVGQNNQIVPRNLKLKTMENVVFDPII